MHRSVTALLVLVTLGTTHVGCSKDSKKSSGSSTTPAPSGGGGGATGDLTALSDTFSGATLSGWSRIYVEEAWGFDQLESLDVGQTRADWLTLVPYTSSWFEDYRGVLVFKPVDGDFVVTTRVNNTARSGVGAPLQQYSLGGIMVRAPRPGVTPATWQPGGENYLFLSLGAADIPGSFQTEVKTTVDSVSTIEINQAAGPEARIRWARIGSALIALIREENTPWRVHRRYQRADLPQTLQVGLTVYTDWAVAGSVTPQVQNTTLLTGNPDLRAQFDFVTYERPQVPASLNGLDLTDPGQVPDSALLAFLGHD